MKKLLLILFIPSICMAQPPFGDTTNNTTNNYYPAPIEVTDTTVIKKVSGTDRNKNDAINRAFSALHFDRDNTKLQWACGYGYASTARSIVCGLGYRVGNKNSLLISGATTIGESEEGNTGNIGIGGTF